jgi:hypothetical protein
VLSVCTWLWGDKYGTDDVAKLAGALKRHLRQPHRLLCMTEREREITLPDGVERHAIKDPELLAHKGCFARLRMFDPNWQANRKITGRMVCVDLDVVITGRLDPLFDRPDGFVILQGANAANPCPFNGSCFMLRAGRHSSVWSDFTLEKARAVPFYEFPDDQGWLHHKIPDAAGWKVGPESGLYAFQKPGWPKGDVLPADARMVVFPGWRSPEKFKHLDWVRENWR